MIVLMILFKIVGISQKHPLLNDNIFGKIQLTSRQYTEMLIQRMINCSTFKLLNNQ